MKVIIVGVCPHYDVFKKYMNRLLHGEGELHLLCTPNPQSSIITWINQWTFNRKGTTIRLVFHTSAYPTKKDMHKDMISQADAIIVFGERQEEDLLAMARKNKLKTKVVRI